MSELTQKNKNWVTEGILLASIPPLAYFLVFTFEMSYCNAFGIPSDLVSVDSSTAYIFVISLIGCLYIISIVAQSFFLSVKSNEKELRPWQIALDKYFPIIGFLLVTQIICINHCDQTLIYLWFFLLMFLVDLIWAAIFRTKEPFLCRMRGIFIFAPKELHSEVGMRIQLFIGMLLCGFVLAASAGKVAALNQASFLVLDSSKNAVVIRVKNEKAICVQYDPLTKEVQNKILIVPISNDRETGMSVAKIGPLKLINR